MHISGYPVGGMTVDEATRWVAGHPLARRRVSDGDDQTVSAVVPVELDAGGWYLQLPWPVLRRLRMSGRTDMLAAVEFRYADRAAAEQAAGWINEWSVEVGVMLDDDFAEDDE